MRITMATRVRSSVAILVCQVFWHPHELKEYSLALHISQEDSIIKDLTESCFHLLSIFQGNTTSSFQLAINQVGDNAEVQIVFACPRIESFAHLVKFIGDNFFPLFYIHKVTLNQSNSY